MVLPLTIGSYSAGVGQARENLTDPNANDIQTVTNRRLCDALATNPGDFAADWFGPVGLAQSFCSPYYQQNNDAGPTVQMPFTGGQCVGVQYNVTVNYTRFDGEPQCQGSAGSSTVSGTGPVSDAGVRSVGNPQPNGDFQQEVFVSFANGDQLVAGGFIDGTCPGFVVDSVSVARQDGQPDNCGDPPSTIEPDPTYSNPVDISSPVTINFDGGDVDVEYDIRTDVDGDEYVRITGPSLEINVGFNGGDPNVPSPPRPPESGDPQDPTTDPDGEVAPPDLDSDERYCIGYRWEVSGVPLARGGIPGTGGVVYPTVFGNFAIAVESGTGEPLWLPNIPIRATRGGALVPFAELRCVRCRANIIPSHGSLIVRPIYRQ